MSSARKPNKSLATNGATPSSSKKRKASVLQDDQEPHKRSTSTPKQSGRKSQGTPQASQVVSSAEGTPFHVECPAKPAKSSKNATDDVFRGRDDGGIPELAIDYAVRPGSKWIGMRSYKNVKLSEQTFSTGSILYVNRHAPAPVPPPDDAPSSDLLKFDRENLWVGRVLECRADSERDVFLRIFWLYWPEELPMGRQSYHGEKELVMSNAMDIIDAQSIASAAEVSYWDEKDEEGDSKLGERFWRQTLDVGRLGKMMKGGLSEVRKHCTCQREYNPDHTMFKCVDEKCGIWNHEECLAENVLDRIYNKSVKGPSSPVDGKKKVNGGSLEVESLTPKQEPAKSPTRHRLFPLEKVGELFSTATARALDMMTPETSATAKEEGGDEKIGNRAPERKPGFPWHIQANGVPRKWAGKFTATVANEDDDVEGKGKVIARVVDIRGAGAKKAGKKEVNEWTEDVCCLRCGTVLI